MYVVVVGGGQVGVNLTKLLLAEGKEVLLVEKDAKRYAQLSDEFGENVILGDGTELGTLMDTGANRADVLIAATGADQDNLIICQTAKILYLIPKTIARVNDPKNEELFQTLGVDATVSSTRIIGSLIEEKIDPGMVIPLMALKGEVEIFQTELGPDSPFLNKKLSKLKLPEDVIIFAAIRGNEVVIPRGDTVFEEGDKILALTKKEGKEEFRKLFL
ncbi:MAG: portal protein [candidate division Zixibacteria bacterium RBG_16_48_11]|nr:MAG: portal protein [candidate division Zixibacteria bacterium RBG_16_48_11]